MKYEVYLNSREIEVVAEKFDFEKFHRGEYDDNFRLDMDREVWQGDIPLYLHMIGIFSPESIIKKSEAVVTPEPLFDIFDKENLTFAEMIQEIWQRRKEIVKITEGDDNPYT